MFTNFAIFDEYDGWNVGVHNLGRYVSRWARFFLAIVGIAKSFGCATMRWAVIGTSGASGVDETFILFRLQHLLLKKI